MSSLSKAIARVATARGVFPVRGMSPATSMPQAKGMSPAKGMFPTIASNPLAPLAAPLHSLLVLGGHVGLGLLACWLGLHAMRHFGLRWTWAAAATCVVVFVRPFSPGLDLALGVATFAIAMRLRRERAGRLGANGARARSGGIVAFARWLVQLCGSCVRYARRQRRVRLRRWFDGERLLVGYDTDARPVEIPIGGESGGTHTFVVGAAGSGKTVTETWIAARAIEHGLPAVIIDPKDDRRLCAEVRKAAANAGRPLIEWSPEGPSVFNPYERGSDTEIADKVLAGERFSEPHYERQAQRYLGVEVRFLRAAGVTTSLKSLARHLDPARLEDMLRTLGEEKAAEGFAYLDSLTSHQRAGLSGVRDRVAIVAESDVGRWLDPETAGAPHFDLLSSLQSRAVVLFRLRSDQRPLVMRMLGAAIVLDLKTTMAALQGHSLRSIAVIDEFAALASGTVGDLFGRARAAGMSIVLGTQEITDLELPDRPNLLRQVTGNLTTLIAHRQVNDESAAWVSRQSGRRERWRTSFASDGRWTASREQVCAIESEQTRALQPGEAVVIVLSERAAGASIAAMLS